MSRVYLMPADGREGEGVLREKVGALFDAAELGDCFSRNDRTALKLHVGEPGTTTFVRPYVAAALVERIAARGARPFLTDSTVLYKSPRSDGIGLTRVALEHGFGLDAVGAPFLVADGMSGTDEVPVPVEGEHFEEVLVASAVAHARSLLVLSHATGHLGTGFGGALKNIGMGCCSRKAKLMQHHGQHPRIDPDLCRGCGDCAEWCPPGAITVEETAEIDDETCIGCGECVAACTEGAVKFDWAVQGRALQERIAEHAAGVLRPKRGRTACVTVVMDVTKNCDCLGVSEQPLLPDIGFLASRDPVALDRATLDLIAERAGRTLESMSYPDRDGSVQIRRAEALGLGESRVELVRLA